MRKSGKPDLRGPRSVTDAALVWPLGPALARELAPRAKRRTEARARPGHERVAGDAIGSSEPLPDPPSASFPIHNVKQLSFFPPGSFCVRVLLPFRLRRCRPPERGDWRSAQRRPAL